MLCIQRGVNKISEPKSTSQNSVSRRADRAHSKAGTAQKESRACGQDERITGHERRGRKEVGGQGKGEGVRAIRSFKKKAHVD